MYIKIKIEIACDQNKLKFSLALIGLAKETFFDFQLVFNQQFAFEFFRNFSDPQGNA